MREEIIREIRSLAAELGRPPGVHIFEAETRIARHEWCGVYWARWGDALREAGFEPNPFQGKADPDAMLEQLALETRWLGRVPTWPELRLLHQANPALPSRSALRNHFGPKPAVLERLRSWAAARPDYADVAAMIATAEPTDAGMNDSTTPSFPLEG